MWAGLSQFAARGSKEKLVTQADRFGNHYGDEDKAITH